MQFYGFHLCPLNVLFDDMLCLFTLTSHTHYPMLWIIFFFMSPPFLFSPLCSLSLCVLCCRVCACTYACLYPFVCLFVCVHAHLLTWCFRGREPSPPQTNSPLSLKAVNSVQTGHRKQAGPAGQEGKKRDGILIMWGFGTNIINVPVVDNQTLIIADRYSAVVCSAL